MSSSPPPACSSLAGSARSQGQFPIQFAAISSAITAAASQMPARCTNPASTATSESRTTKQTKNTWRGTCEKAE